MGNLLGSYHGLVRSEIWDFVDRSYATVLDVGGGVGATSAWLKSKGKASIAGVIDLVEVDPQHDLADFRYTGNLEQEPVIERAARERGPFDMILALDVLEHLKDPWAVVAQMTRSLSSGGIIIASIPNIRHYSALGPLLFKDQWTLEDAGILDRTHLRFFVRSTAIQLMTSSGLKLEAVRGTAAGGRKIKLVRMLTLGIFNGFTNLQYIIRVRKD